MSGTKEQKLEVDVKTISNEILKPSLPPSSQPNTFTLSLLDQLFPAFHIPVLVFYNSSSPTLKGGVDTSALKVSLSQTLDYFYPLAGRFIDESNISCNHEGVPFLETKISCHLSDFQTSAQKLKHLTKFLPPKELQTLGPRPISEVVPLSVQFNVFLCGGVVIGCYVLHKILDISSFGTFLKYWMALASKRYENLVLPDFEATVQAFPPLPRMEQVSVPDFCKEPPAGHSNSTIVSKNFAFSILSLRDLKARAASKLVPAPTRFEALAGFVWEQTLAAAATCDSGAQVEYTSLKFTVNMRPRMSPPLPKESMGNAVTNVEARADKRSRLQELVQAIHSALSSINHKITTVYQGERLVEVLCEEGKAKLQAAMEYEKGLYNYQLSSWCNMGLSEVDFGLGKPAWIIPTDGKQLPPTQRNCIFLTDYSHPIKGEGIEAWLYLEEKEMKILESSPHFLAFASLN